MGAKTNAPPSPAADLEALATELAALTGESVPEAVRAALEERLTRVRRRKELVDELIARNPGIDRRVAASPMVDRLLEQREREARSRRSWDERLASLREMEGFVACYPARNRGTPDEIVGYDEYGLPG